ncbi:MAG TPA: SIMPL domain-containing protein, partial [Tepidisphaeraceae bacterium]|nr:SIMPL domain-containing protein [Tepidisphaeraceae bacterium]
MSDALSHKPSPMFVSLQVGGFFFALANIICVAIFAWAWMNVKIQPKTLSVTGSAKKQIDSDLILWNGTISTQNAQLTKAYDTLKADSDKVLAYLKSKGIPDQDITLSQITTQKHFAKQVLPQQAVNGVAQPAVVIDTDQVKDYLLTQTVTITSKDMDKVPEVARSITSLIKDGVEIDSQAPEYLYTKLAELKIDMLAEATKDATNRATQIVTNAGGRLGKLVYARMGVMQIDPAGSTATSAEGNNDTTSFEKQITAVVEARFELN